MKKTVQSVVLSGLLMTASIAFSQNGENGKATANQAKMEAKTTTVAKQNEKQVAKPASTMATSHQKVADKKTVANQNNTSKK
jgi:hypothetical protein